MNVQNNKETSLQQATAWFAKLDSNAVSDEVKAQFFTWLDANEQNQRSYIEIEQLWGKLAIVERLPVDDMLDRPRWFRSILKPARQLGATLCLLTVTAIALFYLNQPAAIGEQHYITAVGERLEFRLEDGSLLQLNTNSSVTVRMLDSHRLLSLKRGEAYFDIAPNPERPLIVQTNGGMVRVLGTQFNIRQTKTGSIVSVIEGRVAVAALSKDISVDHLDFKPELTLAANRQARLVQDQPTASAAAISGENIVAWRQGQLIYEGNTLSDVIDDLNRYFPGTIELQDPALGNLEIVGVLNLQNKTATLAALEATFGVQVVQATESLTLIQRRD